jgi:hypothetical protein
MGELRRVHPHWDELCGQLLNAAHSNLLHQAQRLLTDCQRRVHREPRMAQPVQLLTRLHVHVLNPVDGMRAFMDEGGGAQIFGDLDLLIRQRIGFN